MANNYVFEGNYVSRKKLLKDMRDVERLARVKELVKLVPSGKRVLDLGCGFGVISKLLSKKSEAVAGIDMLQGNIDIAKEFNSANNVYFVCSSAESLLTDFDNKFQVIVLTEVLEHVENPYGLINDCYNLLEEGGYLIISTPNAVGRVNVLLNLVKGILGVEKEKRGFGTETDHLYCWDARCLLRLCNVNGFKYVTCKFRGASIIMKVVKE